MSEDRFSSSTATFVAATACAAFVFDAGWGALAAIAAAAALGLVVVGLVARRPRRWGARIAYGLLLAYLAAWGVYGVSSRRLAREPEEAVRRLEGRALDEVVAALEDRLLEDRALAERVVDRLRERVGDDRSVVVDPRLFVELAAVVPSALPRGIGVEVYDPAGELRAWWGDPRGDPLPADSVAAAVGGAVVRRPTGYVLAHAAVPWVVGADTFHVAAKDLWALDSPLRREVGEEGLPLAEVGREVRLAFEVRPVGAAGAAPAARATIRGPGGRPVAAVVEARFLLDRFAAEQRAQRERMLALLLLWPLAWSIGAAWHRARGLAGRVPFGGRAGRRAAALAGRVAVLGAVWLFLLETRLLSRLLPAAWFSPLGFASTAFGPAGRSPGDFLVAGALAAIAALTAFALVPSPERGPDRRWTAAGAAVGLGVAWGAIRIAGPLLEEAMRGMSPDVFFSPTLLFSPPLLLVLLGFALLAAVVIVFLAAVARAIGLPTDAAWAGGVAATVAVAIGWAAWRLPEAAMAGERGAISMPLVVALAVSGWAVLAVARAGERPGRRRTVRAGIVAVALGALVVLPLAAFARVEAAHELLVERAQRIGRASTQWLDYTMSRTVEFLAEDPAVVEAIAQENRDAALSLWSRSPLSELDFATGLYLFDVDGRVVSAFSLTAEDLTESAREFVSAVDPAQIAVRGSRGTGAVRWAVVPIFDPSGERVGTAVAMTTGALELREQPPGSTFVLTDLLAGAGLEPDLPGYTTIGPREAVPPRTLLTRVEADAPGPADEEREVVRLAMPLDPLLPTARGYAVFVLVGALAGLLLGVLERLGDLRTRVRWWSALRTENPLRSFRLQLLLAFLAVAAVPLALYAVLGYRATRLELEEATRSAAVEVLAAASRMLAADPALAQGTERALEARLREIAGVLQQDLVLYWRGRTVASSRPEIFASRLFADRMEGEVYADLFVERRALVFDSTALGERPFLVAFSPLREPEAEYVLGTPLLIREDRVRVDLQRLGEGVVLLSAFSIGFLLVVGWGLARFMARPLSELERGTRQIAAGRLSYRLPEPARRDEFGRLQRAFNAMAGRLDASQRALEREKTRVQAILASVGAGVVALDADGRVRLINDRAAALLDVRPADALGRTPAELEGAGGEPTRFWALVEDAFARGRRADRDLTLRRGGETRHLHVVCTALRDGSGEERGLVVAFEDITANVRSQRVLAWGEMARQVAHEIKNPLTPMKLSLQHLERTVAEPGGDFEAVFHRNLDLILAEIDRLERIAGSFARFAVPHPEVLEPFDGVAVARDVAELFAAGDEPVEYEVEWVADPRPIQGEPEGFRRILVNLLQNGREAVLAAGGGRVRVRFDWSVGPDRVRVSVIDDGIGLPEEGVDRLFEPSFSTKTRGTGLGLAITRRIVEAWGGSVDWRRRDEGGTEIRLELPTSSEGKR